MSLKRWISWTFVIALFMWLINAFTTNRLLSFNNQTHFNKHFAVSLSTKQSVMNASLIVPAACINNTLSTLWLDRLLQSIYIGSTMIPFETIISVSGLQSSQCHDTIQEIQYIIEQYISLGYNIITAYHNEPMYSAANRNCAVSMASQKYISLFDVDDIMYPQRMEWINFIFEWNHNIDWIAHKAFLGFNCKFNDIQYRTNSRVYAMDNIDIQSSVFDHRVYEHIDFHAFHGYAVVNKDSQKVLFNIFNLSDIAHKMMQRHPEDGAWLVTQSRLARHGFISMKRSLWMNQSETIEDRRKEDSLHTMDLLEQNNNMITMEYELAVYCKDFNNIPTWQDYLNQRY
eukprot:178859_1